MTIKFVKDRPGHDFRYAINSNKIRKSSNGVQLKTLKGLKETLIVSL